jgi:hypothetical protein
VVVLLFDFGEAAWADLSLCQSLLPQLRTVRNRRLTTPIISYSIVASCRGGSASQSKVVPSPAAKSCSFRARYARLRTHCGNPESWRGASYLPSYPIELSRRASRVFPIPTTTHIGKKNGSEIQHSKGGAPIGVFRRPETGHVCVPGAEAASAVILGVCSLYVQDSHGGIVWGGSVLTDEQ